MNYLDIFRIIIFLYQFFLLPFLVLKIFRSSLILLQKLYIDCALTSTVDMNKLKKRKQIRYVPIFKNLYFQVIHSNEPGLVDTMNILIIYKIDFEQNQMVKAQLERVDVADPNISTN